MSSTPHRVSPERESGDGDRFVEFVEDDVPTLPESTRDDTDEGWGERPGPTEEWLREQRPPHWE
jgi:hypothetical protein